jgi:hypothetical protein
MSITISIAKINIDNNVNCKNQYQLQKSISIAQKQYQLQKTISIAKINNKYKNQ